MNVKAVVSATLAAATVAGALVVSPIAAAQEAKPADEIRYRQSYMNVIGRSFGKLNAMTKGQIPYSKEEATRLASLIESLSTLAPEGFGAGTDKGAPTKANDKVWSEADKFKEGLKKMQSEVGKLVTAARSGDQDALKTQFGETGKACKGCHDEFRLKEFRN